MAGIQGNLSGVRSSAVPEPVNYSWKKHVGNFWLEAADCHDFQHIGGTSLGFTFHQFETGSGGGRGRGKNILQPVRIALDKSRCRAYISF
jgi:hypothetical protein